MFFSEDEFGNLLDGTTNNRICRNCHNKLTENDDMFCCICSWG